MDAGNQTLLKKNNQRAIVETILKHGPISRADLSKKLKISKPTVSANVTELLESNLLREIGYSATDVGKKPMLLDFNREVRYVLALDFISYIVRGRVSAAVCDLSCRPVFTGFIDLPEHFGADTVQRVVPQRLFELLHAQGVPTDKIGKLVLTAPTVEYTNDFIKFECPNGDVMDLADLFRDAFPGKIAIMNDIDLAALGEKHFGVGKDADTLLFAWIGLNVGGGLILNSRLYAGKNKLGGEISYCAVYSEVLREYRMMRDVTSMAGIREYIAARREQAAHSLLAGQLLDGSFTLGRMIEAARRGDSFCREFARYVGRTIAPVLANTSHTLGLQMIIVGGDYTNFGDVFLSEIRERVSAVPLFPAEVRLPRYPNPAMYGAFQFGARSIIKNLI